MTPAFNETLKVFIAIPPGSGSTMIYDAIKKTPDFTSPEPINGKDESSKIAVMIDQDCLPEPDLYDFLQREKYGSRKNLELRRAGRLFGLYLEELSQESRDFEKYLNILESRTTIQPGRCFVEKSPSGSIWAAELSSYLNKVNSNYKFILGLRNPISFIDRTLRSVESNFSHLSRENLIKMCINNWVNIATLQLKNIEQIGSNCMFFTYEDALKDPTGTQEKISSFLGRQIIINDVKTNNNDKTYKALMSDKIVVNQLKILLETHRDLLDRFDYTDLVFDFISKNENK